MTVFVRFAVNKARKNFAFFFGHAVFRQPETANLLFCQNAILNAARGKS